MGWGEDVFVQFLSWTGLSYALTIIHTESSLCDKMETNSITYYKTAFLHQVKTLAKVPQQASVCSSTDYFHL